MQNALLGSSLTEFPSSYRLYSVEALKKVPFERNTNASHFDTEIAIQFVLAGLRIKELPIPAHDGGKVCRVAGTARGLERVPDPAAARESTASICFTTASSTWPQTRRPTTSSWATGLAHTLAIDAAQPGNTVLDVGCGQGYVARELVRKGCHVTGLDQYAPVGQADGATGIEFIAGTWTRRSSPSMSPASTRS